MESLKALSAIEQQVAAISRSTDALEMRSRRGILLLHGIREQKDENLCELSLSLFSNHLGGLKLSADQICKSVRLGLPKQDKPRPLMIKFFSEVVRDSVWYAKAGFKGTGITISESLSC
ncbi:hypothetical protein ACJJTC_015074 [Scirpophaga incertulas]